MTEQQIKKGLFRLWIAGFVCWFFYQHLLFKDTILELLFYGSYPMSWIAGSLGQIYFIVFVPPVILLILGKSIFWILKGFKKQQIKKGLFRLWIVFSVCWVCLVAPLFFDSFLLSRGIILYFGWQWKFLLTLFPVIPLLLGNTIFWIVKGFKKSD